MLLVVQKSYNNVFRLGYSLPRDNGQRVVSYATGHIIFFLELVGCISFELDGARLIGSWKL